jgi:predicted kinase
LLLVARTALEAGWPTIVDAAFLRRAERNAFAELAANLRVPFTILHCDAEPALLRRRIAMRRHKGNDASEADLEVLERLSLLSEPLDPLELEVMIRCEAGNSQLPATLAGCWQAAR